MKKRSVLYPGPPCSPASELIVLRDTQERIAFPYRRVGRIRPSFRSALDLCSTEENHRQPASADSSPRRRATAFSRPAFSARLQGPCRGLAEDTLGGEITPYRPTHEVMGSCIANVLNNSRIYITQINETFGQSGACHSQSRQHDVYQGKANTDEHAKCVHLPSSRSGSRLTKGRRH